ncbi:hypothetical protein RIB2604_00900500 [Aspergillus luchuensis]|uniref:Uncharacterized protein n=1 Tax=Aspergillus kawachii TaxID=1069201 RepID=A0A146F5B8_ASPKA|nr:hypothetical protein RIB2604_00900500 [Aspergillus luchuensis]
MDITDSLRTVHGESPLQLAVKLRRYDIVVLLLDYEANALGTITIDKRLVEIAAEHVDIAMIQLLIANTNVITAIGGWALLRAVSNDQYEAASFLLNQGFDLHSKAEVARDAQRGFHCELEAKVQLLREQ